MSKIDRKYWHFYLPVQPTPRHPSYTTEPLSLEKNKKLRKLSYIDTRRAYRISLALLKRYDDLEKDISSHRLTPESLKIVKTACGLAPSLKIKSRHPVTDATPKIPSINPRPSSKQHTCNHLHAAATEYNVEGNTERYRVFADERGPLLPVPITSRLQNSQAQFPPAWQSLYQPHPDLAATNYCRIYRGPKPILNALLTLLFLCACVILPAALGYTLFHGITWVFSVFATLLTTLEAELVRLGHHIAHISGCIASPFITTREAISTGWRNVVHISKEVVQWFG